MVEAFTGAKISVGAPYFNLTFVPVMSVLLIFMAIGPMLNWRSDNLANYKSTLRKGVIALGLIAIIFGLFGKSGLGGLSLGLATALAAGTAAVIVKKIRWGKVSKQESWRLLRAQPAATFGFIGAHLGMAIFVAGATSISVWGDDDIRALKVGESISLGRYEFTLEDMTPGQRENYQYLGANVSISKNGSEFTDVYTERRYYPVREMVTTEAGLHLSLSHTLFAAIGEGDSESGWVVRVYHHPFVVWIWFGAFLMALGGFLSLFDRRLRFGVPKRVTTSSTSLAAAE